MKHYLGAGVLAAVTAFSAVPASAALSIDAGRCTSVLEADGGCVFVDPGPGGANDNNVALVESVYNLTGKAGSPIDLNLIGKIERPATTGPFGSITYDSGNKTGTWSLPGYAVDFISVKAANEFILIKLATAASSGSWSTAGLLNNGGNQPAISHIQFYGSEAVIPEPATWAMLIAGFGLVGSAMRRRRGVASVNA